MRPLTLITSLTTLSSTTYALNPNPTLPNLGHWDINITSLRSAAGHAAQHTWAIYSGNPAKTIYDEWSFDAMSGNTTAQRSDRSFRVDVEGGCAVGLSVVSIKQTVDDGTRTYWIAGAANVTFIVNPVTGRGGSASFRVDAVLDDTAKDACGRPLNHE